MTWEPPRADADTLARRAELARAVRDDLGAAGLPVVPEDAGPSVSEGAQVTVDPLGDEAGGVYVSWGVRYALRAAALDAVSEGRGPEDPSTRLFGGTSEAMQDAIAGILTSAGYDVEKDANDMAPYQLAVLGRRPGPSWQDWLSEQTARRQETMMATARAREDARTCKDD